MPIILRHPDSAHGNIAPQGELMRGVQLHLLAYRLAASGGAISHADKSLAHAESWLLGRSLLETLAERPPSKAADEWGA